ncbi:MAG: hypothetical protein BWX44_01183 [Spirochaetes bacterium ADurb.Bin001]|nr:MAG: hypothetical protein BWX44_01183 [Spirochaetes bacterium ADurb.Bin001]
MTIVVGVSLDEPVAIGIHRERSKGKVPDIEATPGRFHGPKISQILRAVATKLSPRPPKISFTPPKVLSAPASIAHSIPPNIPAKIAMTRMSEGFHSEFCKSRIAQVVNIAPSVIWPSIPMFHKPTVKVKSSPEVARSKGTQETRTLLIKSQEPTAPKIMAL